jgi:hypothetical protein
MFDPIALDLREQSTGAIFAMARSLADQIEASDSLTLVLVTGEEVDPRTTIRLVDRLVQEAIWRKHRGIAKRLYDAANKHRAALGYLHPTFEQSHPKA